jgi:hypothetical protein
MKVEVGEDAVRESARSAHPGALGRECQVPHRGHGLEVKRERLVPRC